MKNVVPKIMAGLVAGVVAGALVVSTARAADADEDKIKDIMKTLHKAPKGVEPVCKKAVEGKATPEEIKKLVEAYKVMAKVKPPQGDEASWKEKTEKLVMAAEGLEKGHPGAQEKYKAAVDCKACHKIHRPD